MPSKTFQPLLFDLLKFTLPKSTYQDHYSRKIRKKTYKYENRSPTRLNADIHSSFENLIDTDKIRNEKLDTLITKVSF
jgi:hypothetical protein